MKARLLANQDADITKVTALHPPTKPVERYGKIEHIFPAGSEFVGQQAVQLVLNGMATPSDDECEKEVGATPEQLAEWQIMRRMIDLGIYDKDDQKLYRGGVILGYKPDGSYDPGPNFDEYKAAEKELKRRQEETL